MKVHLRKPIQRIRRIVSLVQNGRTLGSNPNQRLSGAGGLIGEVGRKVLFEPKPRLLFWSLVAVALSHGVAWSLEMAAAVRKDPREDFEHRLVKADQIGI